MQFDNAYRDFRYAIRNLRKDRRFVATAIFALALGIASATVVFSVFYSLLFNALAAKDSERLVVPVRQDLDKAGDRVAADAGVWDSHGARSATGRCFGHGIPERIHIDYWGDFYWIVCELWADAVFGKPDLGSFGD
jgi:hypothetical protein